MTANVYIVYMITSNSNASLQMTPIVIFNVFLLTAQCIEDTKQTATRAPTKKQRPPESDLISLQFSSLSMGSKTVQAISGNLSCPMLSGRWWEHFDFEHDRIYAYVLMQMVIITGVLHTQMTSNSVLSTRDHSRLG